MTAVPAKSFVFLVARAAPASLAIAAIIMSRAPAGRPRLSFSHPSRPARRAAEAAFDFGDADGGRHEEVVLGAEEPGFHGLVRRRPHQF